MGLLQAHTESRMCRMESQFCLTPHLKPVRHHGTSIISKEEPWFHVFSFQFWFQSRHMPDALSNFLKREAWVLQCVTLNQDTCFPSCQECWLLMGIALLEGSYCALLTNCFTLPPWGQPDSGTGRCGGTKARRPLHLGENCRSIPARVPCGVGWGFRCTNITVQFLVLLNPASL